MEMADFHKRMSEKLDTFLENNPKCDKYVCKIQEKVKVKKIYLAYGAIVLIGGWLIFGHGAALLCNGIGFLYPMYMSIKALETDDKDDDTQWLMYWVVFSFFSVIEFFADILVGWIPAYWFSKCIFLLWCMSGLNGAEKVYRIIILPWFQKNVAKLDKAVDDIKKAGKGFLGENKEVIDAATKMAIAAADTSNGEEVKKDS